MTLTRSLIFSSSRSIGSVADEVAVFVAMFRVPKMTSVPKVPTVPVVLVVLVVPAVMMVLVPRGLKSFLPSDLECRP